MSVADRTAIKVKAALALLQLAGLEPKAVWIDGTRLEAVRHNAHPCAEPDYTGIAERGETFCGLPVFSLPVHAERMAFEFN